MEVPLPLQLSIAVFTGMVAATFVPPVRKAIPRTAELLLWVALITVCALGVKSVTDAKTRDVSAAALWGAQQAANAIPGLLLGGVGGWIDEQRVAIAGWLVIAAGVDALALMLFHALRREARWSPRVRLRDWVELPLPEPDVSPGWLASASPVITERLRLAATAAMDAAAHLNFAARAWYDGVGRQAIGQVIDIRGLLGAQSSREEISDGGSTNRPDSLAS